MKVQTLKTLILAMLAGAAIQAEAKYKSQAIAPRAQAVTPARAVSVEPMELRRRGSPRARVVADINPRQAKEVKSFNNWVRVDTPEGPGFVPKSEWQQWKNSQYSSSGGQDSEAGYTTNGYCPSGQCDRGPRAQQQPSRESFFFGLFSNPATTTNNSCTDRLLTTARGVANYYDRNGNTAEGKCAYAVRLALNKAGIHRGGGLGHAKDMGPGLESLGYQNVFRPGMTAANAPVGAILVYDRALRGARGCTGLGNRYGHVEIKDFGGRYLYDGTVGRSIEETKGRACRPLKGVYVPSSALRC